MAAGTKTRQFSKRYFSDGKSWEELSERNMFFRRSSGKSISNYKAIHKEINNMTLQTRAKLLLQSLKAAGISYKAFAQAANIPVENIYALSCYRTKLTEERADFYIRAAAQYFPEQYAIIKPRLDDLERTHPGLQ